MLCDTWGLVSFEGRKGLRDYTALSTIKRQKKIGQKTMEFNLNKSLEILEKTPQVLVLMLDELSDDWTTNNEGPDTWSPYDIVGHLIHGEKTDWIPRMDLILSDHIDKTFTPFDRFAQFEHSKGKTLKQLLYEFKALREDNTQRLRSINLTNEKLEQKGICQ
jgi:hypothetical protein